MKFNRQISVNGTIEIENINVSFSFTYNFSEKPQNVSFSFNKLGTYVSGIANIEDITNYNVSNGIIDINFLNLVKSECKNILENYETV